MRRKKRSPLKILRDRAWTVWSIHVRSRDADFSGYARCYTCRRHFLWNEMHAGHFLHGNLDFDERNVHPQCIKCNYHLSGNLGEYAEHLIEEYGPDILKDLKREAAVRGNKYTKEELEQIIFKHTLT